MTVRTTIFLSMLSAVFAVFLWHSLPAPPPHQVSRPEPLLDFPIQDIVAFEIRSNTGSVECARTAEGWLITSPTATRANPVFIARAFAGLEQYYIRERFALNDLPKRGLSIADYGLQQPAAVLVFGTKHERQILEVGICSPLGDAVYARRQGRQEVLAVSTGLFFMARANLESMRDPRLVRADESAVIRLELKAAGKPLIQLSREGQSWMLQKPVSARASAKRTHDLLGRILRLEARSFVSETMADPMAYGVGEDEAMFQISFGFARGRQSERLLFGKPLAARPELVYAATRAGRSVMAVELDEIKLLNIRPEDIRDRRLPIPPRAQVRAIRLKQGESTLALSRASKEEWWITEPLRRPADKDRVEGFFHYLGGIRVEAFLSASERQTAAIDMTLPIGSLTLSYAAVLPGTTSGNRAQQNEFNMRFYNLDASNGFAAVCGDADEFLELPPDIRHMLDLDPMWFRDLTVFELDPDDVRSITTRTAAGRQIVDRDERGEWRATPVSPGIADVNLIKNVLAWAAELRALRIEPDSHGDSPEWRAPRLSIVFGLGGEGGIQKTIHFGADTADGKIRARVQGQDDVFILDRALAQKVFLRGLVHQEPD